jgi:predicted TIM-barrel fold metal-dependent hydrolase
MMKIWDIHCHPDAPGATPGERIANILKYADRMGIERLCIFMGHPWDAHPSPELLRKTNDDILAMVQAHGDRVFGFVYLNPQHPQASLDELERCVANGPMVGVKLWQAVKASDPALDPIVQRAAELKALILQDSFIYSGERPIPSSSGPEDVVALSARHPGVPLICAHTGGNWELGIRVIRASKDVYCELSGSEPTNGFVEMAVRELGAERIVYGSDVVGRSFSSQLSKVTEAAITDEQKQLILHGNLRRLLLPILTVKGIKF